MRKLLVYPASTQFLALYKTNNPHSSPSPSTSRRMNLYGPSLRYRLVLGMVGTSLRCASGIGWKDFCEIQRYFKSYSCDGVASRHRVDRVPKTRATSDSLGSTK
jgi:hypothetical protein